MMDIQQDIENMELELAKKKQKLRQMQGADEPQNGNTSVADPVTGDVEYAKLKKQMLLKKMMAE